MLVLELLLVALILGLIIGGVIGKIWLIALIFVCGDIVLTLFIKRRKGKKEIPPVDQTFFMNGTEFEKYVAEVFISRGYKVKIVGGSGDQGIDIIAKKFFFSLGIQAKCYEKPVPNKAIMEAVAGKKFYRLKKAVVVTNSIFTPSAKTLAKKCRVKLIDKKQLASLVMKLNGKRGF